MTITNSMTGTNVHEIAAGIYRISTPVPPSVIPGGFTFNQFLVVDEAPLLYHTGSKAMFPLVQEAVAHVLGSASKVRYISFSHFEADECGSLNQWLEVAPEAETVCGAVAAMLSINDFAIRAPRVLTEADELSLGKKRVRWLDTPNLPHNWECGHLFEATTRTLFCGDVFTHTGADVPALTEGDIVGPAEATRLGFQPGAVAIEANTGALIEKLASTEPATLAVMHGSSYRGDGARVLRDWRRALGV